MRVLSCGVVVSDGERILLGHATRSPRWDIPKGVAEPGEAPLAAARRELLEETGLVAPDDALIPLGTHPYMSGKDLALFLWRKLPLPDPKTLTCSVTFTARDGVVLPEFDRFALFPWDEALQRVGRNLSRLLAELRPSIVG